METPLPLDPNAGAPPPDPAAPNVTGTPAGTPTAPTAPQVGAGPTAPQPAAPPKESFAQGVGRGMRGKSYVVDGQGNVVEARTTDDSGSGKFGSILGGIVMGALAGASKSRPGRIPSQEIGGGAGAGVGAAIEQSQQQDARNRGKAEQDFANKQATQKMSREQAESAATINHLAASTASIAQEAQFAKEDHPLSVALKQAGLDEANSNIQKNAQEIMTNSMKISETLGEAGVDPSALVSSWSQAGGHTKDIVQGRTLPIFNGQKGSDAGVGMYDAQALKTTPLPKPVTYKTYTSDAKGNPVEKENTLPAGTSAFDYIQAAMAGNGQLQKINSQQKVQGAADLNKADIKEKLASANKDNAEAWAATHPGMIQGGGGAPVMSDEMKTKIGSLPPDKQAIISKYDANTQAALMSVVDSPGDIAFEKLFPASPRAKSGLLSGQQAEGILSQLIPGWSMQEYKLKQTAYKDAFNGKDGQAIQNYGNVMQHMASAQDVFEKYRQGTPKLWNTALNKLEKEGLGTEASELEASLTPVRNEFSLLMSGGFSPKGDEQKAIDTVLNPSSNAAQIEAAFKVFGNTGTIRLDNVNEGYKRASRGQNLPGIVSQSTVDAARHLNLEPAAQARLNKFNVGGSFFGDKGAAAGASAPAATSGGTTAAPAAAPAVQYATAPGKPRLMSKDGGKTWQPAQ